MDKWVDAYAPQKLDDIIGQKKLVTYFKNCIARGFIPDLTLAGPPGSTKTTVVKCWLNDIGYLNTPGQCQILNASDDRGIEMVRNKLKTEAAKPTTFFDTPRVIVLDEGDHITADAQAAMRAIIEEFSSTTRFIIICNYPRKILDPIISRCPMLVVYPLTKQDVEECIKKIQEKEHFAITPDAIDVIYTATKGDLRKMIGLLQNAAVASNFNITREHISNPDVDLEMAKKIIEIAQTDFAQARDMVITIYIQQKSVQSLLEKMYQAAELVPFVQNREHNEIIQRRLQDKISDVDYRLTQGTNQLIQVDSILAYERLLKYMPISCPSAK